MPTIQEDLSALRLPELQQRFLEVTGQTTRSPNKQWLIRKIEEARSRDEPVAGTEAAAAAPSDAIGEPTSTQPHEGLADGAIEEDETSVGTSSAGDLAPAEELEPTGELAVAPEVLDDQEGASSIDGGGAHDAATCGHVDPPPAPGGAGTRGDDAGGDRSERTTANAPVEDDAQREGLAVSPMGSEHPDDVGEEENRDDDGDDPILSCGFRREELRQHGVLAGLPVEKLKVAYVEVIGRPTGSDDKGYLVWKIREALKGRIPVGARAQRDAPTGRPSRVLPLRLDVDSITRMERAWRRGGLRNRAEFLREAIDRHADHLEAQERGTRSPTPVAAEVA